jgi:hypothetical protein
MAINHQGKIITLWSVFLLGTLFHTQLGLMPLFHGINIAHTEPTAVNMDLILWLMLGFFVLPMFAVIATGFTDDKRYRLAHFSLTVIYSVLNFLHLALDLMVQPIVWSQIALMAILFAIGLLLNLVAFQWLQERGRVQRQRHMETHRGLHISADRADT